MSSYFENRVMDLSDIVDLKYGFRDDAIGLGAKVEALEFLGAGVGLGDKYDTTEFYGRRARRYEEGYFQAVILGLDGPMGPCFGGDSTLNLLGLNLRDWHPHPTSWPRAGGELWLPWVNFGIYGNLGEAADFLLGIFGLDISDDDGLAKGAHTEDRASVKKAPEKSETEETHSKE